MEKIVQIAFCLISCQMNVSKRSVKQYKLRKAAKQKQYIVMVLFGTLPHNKIKATLTDLKKINVKLR